jgi:hypothetical protein
LRDVTLCMTCVIAYFACHESYLMILEDSIKRIQVKGRGNHKKNDPYVGKLEQDPLVLSLL